MPGLEGATVLVTGGTGFIGSHLVERLVALRCRVRCLVRRKSSLEYLPVREIDLAYGDLAGGEGLQAALDGARFVFHLAGVTKAREASRFYAGNAAATCNLLSTVERMPEPPERVVHISSLAAIGPSPDGSPLDEDATPCPLTHYGKSKLAAEQAVAASPVASRTVILRPPVVYGPRDSDVFEIFRAAAHGVFLRIGRAESLFSYIFVRDLVDAMVAAIGAPAAPGHAYFTTSGRPVSWGAFSAAIGEVTGRKIRTVTVPSQVAYAMAFLAEFASRLRGKQSIISREKVREARCRYWVCDASRARRDLGFVAVTPLGDGIRETLAWYKKAGWLRF